MSVGTRHPTTSARPGEPNDRPPAPAPPPPPRWRRWLLPLGVLTTLVLLSIPHMTGKPTESYSYSKFLSEVASGGVRTASVNPSGAITGTLKRGDNYTSQIPTAITDTQLAPTLKAHDVDVTGVGQGSALLDDLLSFLPILLFIAVFIWIGRRSSKQLAGIKGIGGSKAKVYDEDRPTTRLADVAGYEGAKQEVTEVVDFLRHPERYAQAGATGPRGVLMVGPPGTGKTLMARAVAGEAEVPFLALTGSSFVELFVGVGASRVRDLFADARKRSPSIIFIDEIDAIGQRRGGSFGSNDEREQTLNQLLAEMDGFDPSTGVVVMAATNRPEVLDPALLRPGRFDREVEIPLPNQAERCAILAVHVAGKHLAPDVDFDAVARATPGFSGADLANLLNEAAIVAVRDNRDVIFAKDIDEARDRVLLGRRDVPNALLPEEKHSVAVHEAGHALVAFLSAHADPVARITILPVGSRAGRHRTAAGRRASPVRRELPARLTGHPPGWASLGEPGHRRGLDRGGQRLVRGHRPGHQDGEGLGIVIEARAHRVWIGPAFLSEWFPIGPGTALLRRHPTGHRPGGEPPAHRSRGEGPRAAGRQP